MLVKNVFNFENKLLCFAILFHESTSSHTLPFVFAFVALQHTVSTTASEGCHTSCTSVHFLITLNLVQGHQVRRLDRMPQLSKKKSNAPSTDH